MYLTLDAPPHSGHDLIEISDPLERLGLGVVIFQEAVEGDLKVADKSEEAALQAALYQDGIN